MALLWDARAARVPCLLVVDEAHNICPRGRTVPSRRLSTETAVRIAAEGRKYGLYLMCSTQQPHKVHENVVSQCDNLLLMRMNSQCDIADLARHFSFVPEGLVGRAATFAWDRRWWRADCCPNRDSCRWAGGSPARAVRTSRLTGRPPDIGEVCPGVARAW